MAGPKSYSTRATFRFLSTDYPLAADDSTIFELDEADVVWNTDSVHSVTQGTRRPSSRVSRKTSIAALGGEGTAPASSLPVNVPDWSKILKDEYRENRFRGVEGDCDVVDEGNMIPPHEFLARRRIASFSVHEGIGRTLKGRDLSRVRNAIWQKTGFQD